MTQGLFFLGRSEMENFRLKVFRTVADNLNFRQAAEALYLTQPAVTLQIKALEEELGVPLFDRTENRVALTEAGQILLKHAKNVEALTAAARRELSQLVCDSDGDLSARASAPLIVRGRGAGDRRVGEAAQKAAGIQMKHTRTGMELDSTEAITSAVEAGLGVGLVSRRAIQKERKRDPLREAHIPKLRMHRGC